MSETSETQTAAPPQKPPKRPTVAAGLSDDDFQRIHAQIRDLIAAREKIAALWDRRVDREDV